MKKFILGIVIALVVIVLVAAAAINTSYVQDKLVGLAEDALSEELETDVHINDLDLNLMAGHVTIYGVKVKDQQGRDLLKVKDIWGNVRLLSLLRGKLILKAIHVNDIDVLVVKPDEGPANYQFLIDVINEKVSKKDKTKKTLIKVDLEGALAKNVRVKYNSDHYQASQVAYHHRFDRHTLTVEHLKYDWKKYTRKGITSWHMDTGLVTVDISDNDQKRVFIKGLEIGSDNHRPRRNTGKPHHGAFDWGHMDLTADLGFDILNIGKDSVTVRLASGCIRDSIAGIDFNDLRSDITIVGNQLYLTDAVVQQTTTRLDIPKAEIRLPSKKSGTKLHYRADSIYGRVMLKDIAKPFAPVLHKFSIPLNLRVNMSGTDEGMTFRGIHVNTDDQKLTISGIGILRNLKEGRKLALHFDIHDMVARPGIKDKIIDQFTVKKYMMYQVYALGVIKYHGSFDVFWRRQVFRGLMNTEKGDVNFEFEVNGNDKYLTGNVSTDSLNLGELFQLKKIGNIDCKADFRIDISKERTGEMRKMKGGKLPIGYVKADIKKVAYRSMNLKNIFADIQSDGAVAEGDVTMKGSLTDLVLEFSFTNTTEMHKMKVKPRLKFRSLMGRMNLKDD